MRESLLKKRYGIPAALLLALLISIGVAGATFVVNALSTSTEVREPISVSEGSKFEVEMNPGTSNTWEFNVTNVSKATDYHVSYHVIDSVDDENGVSITAFTIGDTDYLSDLQGVNRTVEPGDEVIDKLDAGATKEVVLTIYAETDAPSQHVDLIIEIGRE